MDAVEFLKERKRLCHFAKYCENCPLHIKGSVCSFTTSNESDECAIVSTVEQWAKEHPIKTRQSEFLKMFSNARIESDGMPSICPIVVDKRCHNKDDDALFCLVRDEEECRKCRRDYWLQEVK